MNLSYGKREGTEDSLNSREHRFHELNYLWEHLDKEGRRAWIIEARGIYRLQIINRVFHILLISVLIITIISFYFPAYMKHYPFMAVLAYITAVNLFVIRYKIKQIIHKNHG